MISSFEQSFKKRLQAIAKGRNMTPSEVWQNVVHECFLIRLCRSPYRDNFILKGGVLLAKHINIGRETKDLDFSVRQIQSDIKRISEVMHEIVSIDPHDGFTFHDIKIEELDHFHMEYVGARVKMVACLGKARLPLFIDLGFGDFVQEKEEKISLLMSGNEAPFTENLNLHCYPVEFVFAEKLETIVFRGGQNSRMKDYHDLYSMTYTDNILDKELANLAVRSVFTHRNTALRIPLRFEIAALENLQNFWVKYRKNTSVQKNLPS